MDKSSTPLNTLNQSLHASGRRMTSKRALVLKILEESTEHLDAETIWERAKAQDERINLATVYRTLTVLKEMGMVDLRYFARDHKREVYEPTSKPEHYHFTCTKCGNITEFATNRINQMRSHLQDEIGVVLTHTCVCLEGYCHRCAEKNTHHTE